MQLCERNGAIDRRNSGPEKQSKSGRREREREREAERDSKISSVGDIIIAGSSRPLGGR